MLAQLTRTDHPAGAFGGAIDSFSYKICGRGIKPVTL
jgi:hypothetical protein